MSRRRRGTGTAGVHCILRFGCQTRSDTRVFIDVCIIRHKLGGRATDKHWLLCTGQHRSRQRQRKHRRGQANRLLLASGYSDIMAWSRMARNSLPPPTTRSRLCAIIRHYGEQSPRSTKAPKYLVDCCNPDRDTASRRRLRSAGRHYLTVPRYRLGSFGRRAFSAAGPTVWNSLPDSLRDPALSSSSNSFRQQGGLL